MYGSGLNKSNAPNFIRFKIYEKRLKINKTPNSTNKRYLNLSIK